MVYVGKVRAKAEAKAQYEKAVSQVKALTATRNLFAQVKQTSPKH